MTIITSKHTNSRKFYQIKNKNYSRFENVDV